MESVPGLATTLFAPPANRVRSPVVVDKVEAALPVKVKALLVPDCKVSAPFAVKLVDVPNETFPEPP